VPLERYPDPIEERSTAGNSVAVEEYRDCGLGRAIVTQIGAKQPESINCGVAAHQHSTNGRYSPATNRSTTPHVAAISGPVNNQDNGRGSNNKRMCVIVRRESKVAISIS